VVGTRAASSRVYHRRYPLAVSLSSGKQRVSLEAIGLTPGVRALFPGSACSHSPGLLRQLAFTGSHRSSARSPSAQEWCSSS
jgi:hypothetical protein